MFGWEFYNLRSSQINHQSPLKLGPVSGQAVITDTKCVAGGGGKSGNFKFKRVGKATSASDRLSRFLDAKVIKSDHVALHLKSTIYTMYNEQNTLYRL